MFFSSDEIQVWFSISFSFDSSAVDAGVECKADANGIRYGFHGKNCGHNPKSTPTPDSRCDKNLKHRFALQPERTF